MVSLYLTRFSFWLCLIGIGAAIFLLVQTSIPQGISEPVMDPPVKPGEAKVAGSGIVEARGRETRVSAPVSGVVHRVLVGVGDRVQTGQTLFELDRELIEAEMEVAQAGRDVAEAELARLQKVLDRLEAVQDKRAVSEAELESRRGELKVAQAQVDQAKARVRQVETHLKKFTVESPRDGTVLQVNSREGEFTSPGTPLPPVLIGDPKDLVVRTDIDEEFVPQLPEEPRGTAYLRGFSGEPIDLVFVNFDPMIVPKRNLSGMPGERVDTRVLQAIFELADPSDREKHRLFLGQQLDVFIVDANAPAEPEPEAKPETEPEPDSVVDEGSAEASDPDLSAPDAPSESESAEQLPSE